MTGRLGIRYCGKVAAAILAAVEPGFQPGGIQRAFLLSA
jgi:hypothetical protein